MPKLLVIYNPIAGRGRVQTYWPEVEKALHKAGFDFVALPTRAPLDATKMAERAPGVYSAVIGVGGDGTIHEIVNGLALASGSGETLPVGVIPLGNGDDFAKIIPPEAPVGGKPFDWRSGITKIAQMQTKALDLGRITAHGALPSNAGSQHYFMNGMDIGFGAHGVLNFTTIPRFISGFPAYLATVFKTMVRYPLLPVRVQLDDQPPFEQVTAMTAVMNGRCFGSGFWVTPGARPDDGLFEVMVAQGVGRLTILRLVPKFMRGTHLAEKVLRFYQARKVVLESQVPLVVEADGELPYREAHRLVIEILPRKLRVIV
ncbi:MAG TPA: diacylglycerol kinase family protein [Anaerolineales bacterium]|nr:diacylglycerol kinase family protein [Anaerolineales bacterium]